MARSGHGKRKDQADLWSAWTECAGRLTLSAFPGLRIDLTRWPGCRRAAVLSQLCDTHGPSRSGNPDANDQIAYQMRMECRRRSVRNFGINHAWLHHIGGRGIRLQPCLRKLRAE